MSSVTRLALVGTVALCATALAAAEGTTIPKGTSVELILQDGLSTRTAKVGDTFRARVVPAIDIDDQPVLPEGTVFIGQSSAGRASTLVGDDLAEGYSNSGLGAAEATVSAGTQITMEFAEPLTGLPAAERTAANPKVRHIRVAHAWVAAAQQALTEKARYYHGEVFNYLNHVSGLHVNGSVDHLVVSAWNPNGSPKTVLFYGTGGRMPACSFEVAVEDNGEPGRRKDEFGITVTGGLSEVTSQRVIDRGNIQFHKNCGNDHHGRDNDKGCHRDDGDDDDDDDGHGK